MSNAFTWQSLQSLLRGAHALGFFSLTCKEYFQKSIGGSMPRKTILFRIDVDRSLSDALVMARVFSKLKVKASFFFRVHAPLYNMDLEQNCEIVKQIHHMGFEVGLHAEPLVQAHLTGSPPRQVLQQDLKKLQSIIDNSVVGVASHGDGRFPNINNLEFWQNYRPDEFGLWYEAYDEQTFGLFQNSRYISDSNLIAWKAYENGQLLSGDTRAPLEHMKEGRSPIYILIHPFLFGSPDLVEPPLYRTTST